MNWKKGRPRKYSSVKEATKAETNQIYAIVIIGYIIDILWIALGMREAVEGNLRQTVRQAALCDIPGCVWIWQVTGLVMVFTTLNWETL